METKTNVQLPLKRRALGVISALGLLQEPSTTKTTIAIRALLVTHPDVIEFAKNVMRWSDEEIADAFTELPPGGQKRND